MAYETDVFASPATAGTSKGFLARFLKARDGQAAVEMALVATPFFMLLFGVLELALIFLVSSSLENATALAARTIRTGSFQNGGAPNAAAFKTTICNAFGWLQADCMTNLSIDVRTFQSFASITAPQPVQNGQFNPAVLSCNPGAPGDIVVVRAYYQWPLIAPLMSQALQQISGGKALITSTATFRNEPYNANGAPQGC
jgi:Flp pilus assembly protein TadG